MEGIFRLEVVFIGLDRLYRQPQTTIERDHVPFPNLLLGERLLIELSLFLDVGLWRMLNRLIEQVSKRAQRRDNPFVSVAGGGVDGLVQRSLVGVELQDRAARGVGVFGGDWIHLLAVIILMQYDLLDILIGDVVKRKEVSPSLLEILSQTLLSFQEGHEVCLVEGRRVLTLGLINDLVIGPDFLLRLYSLYGVFFGEESVVSRIHIP